MRMIVVYAESDEGPLWPIAGIEARSKEELEKELASLHEKIADMAVANARAEYDADEDLDEDERRSRDEHLQRVREYLHDAIRADPWEVEWYVAGERDEQIERRIFGSVTEYVDLVGGWPELV